jgi:predicted RecA/RadA family phage recombinase
LLRSFGYSSLDASDEQIKESIEANRDREKLLAEASIKHRNITVQYFPKAVDGQIVSNRLKQAGFNVLVMARPVNDLPTNAIWAGDAVTVEDVKLVALTLIRAGVQLRAIKRSRPRRQLETVIQVGTEPALSDAKVLKVNDIMSLKEIHRR